jgi:hypothetical protein
MKRVLLFIVLCSVSLLRGQIYFDERASSYGLGLSSGDTPIGSGITFYDYDNDGWDDITLATESGIPLRFFKNATGFFVEEFFNMPINTSQVKQVNWVDFDNDGDKDLYVTSNTDGNKLYLNDAEFNFTDVTVISGLPSLNIFTYGASWGDYDNDGYLDVFLSNRDPSEVIPNYLYKNNGNGTFTNVSSSAGILATGNLSFCSAFFDFNNDGWQDIYVSKDRIENLNILYKNNGDGTFTDVSQSSGAGLAIDAMSVTIDDYDNDGFIDIYVTNTPNGNVFLKNNGDETFTNIALDNGTAFNSIGWGATFLDADNDMDLDLYVSGLLTGSVPDLLSAAFYENDGFGIYTIPVSSGFVGDTRESYSNAIGDVDNDGLPEIAVNNANDENMFIWRNQTITNNNWLKVKLEGTQSNKDGIGSRIEISINGITQYRYTLCGEGYLAQNSGTEIFGLGTNTMIDYVKITWLSGVEDVIFNVNANQVMNIVEGSTLSDNEFELTKDIIIYQDIRQNTININATSQIKKVELLNILGRKLYEAEVNSNIFKLNSTFLSNGVYIINVFTNGSNIMGNKLIKQ